MPSELDVIISEWRSRWVSQHARYSHHDLKFWEEVADTLLEGRLALKNNPLVPVGQYALSWPGALEMLVARNNHGIEFERQGKIDETFFVYEVSVSDEFFGTHPYDRLRILYSRQGWYEDAIRVCQAYLNIPVKQRSDQTRKYFEHHVERLKRKLS